MTKASPLQKIIFFFDNLACATSGYINESLMFKLKSKSCIKIIPALKYFLQKTGLLSIRISLLFQLIFCHSLSILN